MPAATVAASSNSVANSSGAGTNSSGASRKTTTAVRRNQCRRDRAASIVTMPTVVNVDISSKTMNVSVDTWLTFPNVEGTKRWSREMIGWRPRFNVMLRTPS